MCRSVAWCSRAVSSRRRLATGTASCRTRRKRCCRDSVGAAMRGSVSTTRRASCWPTRCARRTVGVPEQPSDAAASVYAKASGVRERFLYRLGAWLAGVRRAIGVARTIHAGAVSSPPRATASRADAGPGASRRARGAVWRRCAADTGPTVADALQRRAYPSRRLALSAPRSCRNRRSASCRRSTRSGCASSRSSSRRLPPPSSSDC